MTDGDEVLPQDLLRRLGKVNIILGIVSLVRLLPEMASVFVMAGAHWRYLGILALDVLVGVLWLRGGLVLRKEEKRDFGFAAFAGALVFAHSITSGWFVGRELLMDLSPSRHSSDRLFLMALSGSRLLIYAIEFLSQPFLVMRLRILAAGDDRASGRSMGGTIVGWFLVAGLVQTVFFLTLTHR